MPARYRFLMPYVAPVSVSPEPFVFYSVFVTQFLLLFYAPVAQRIERQFPKLCAPVRVRAGVLLPSA